MTRFAGFVAVVSCMFVLVSPTVARDIYVAKTGSNSNTGTSSSPYLTIAYAISKAVSNDIIHVKAGTYNETYVTLKSNLTLVSEDGVYAAKLSSYNGGSSRGFVIVGSGSAISNVEINGFESYSTCGGGTAGDGLLRIYNSDNIRIKNCLIHDAPLDCDVVKIGGFNTTTSNTLIENCVIYNPAPAVAGGHAQCLDAHPVNGLTVRGCWIYHTPDHPADILIRANGGSSNVLWENNVFGPSYDDGRGSPATSAGTVDSDTPQVPSVDGMTVRNNLFLSCQGEGAFRVDTSRNVKFYNNLIWNYLGTGAAVSFRNDPTKNPPGTSGTQGLDFCNNIVCNTNGKPAFVALGTYVAGSFNYDYNLYWQIAAGGFADVTAEPHSLFVDPVLAAPATPSSGSWAAIVPQFKPLDASAAINAGTNPGALVPADINGVVRPIGSYDIGPYEVRRVGDLNSDGHVDATDLLSLVSSWGKHAGDPGYSAACDFNADSGVDVVDLLLLADNWGR